MALVFLQLGHEHEAAPCRNCKIPRGGDGEYQGRMGEMHATPVSVLLRSGDYKSTRLVSSVGEVQVSEIKMGELVQLKSGSIDMTYLRDENGDAVCSWRDDKGVDQTLTYDKLLLKPAPRKS